MVWVKVVGDFFVGLLVSSEDRSLYLSNKEILTCRELFIVDFGVGLYYYTVKLLTFRLILILVYFSLFASSYCLTAVSTLLFQFLSIIPLLWC